MKKAQVLSAIALAFALGVVAPVASTYAAIVDGDAQAVTDATKALNDAISEAELVGGYLGTYTAYARYNQLGIDIAKAEKAIADQYATEAGATLTSAQSLVPSITVEDNTDYDAVMAAIQAECNSIAYKLQNKLYPEGDESTMQGVLTGLQGFMATARTNMTSFIDGSNGQVKGIVAAIKGIDSDYDGTNKTYAQAVADAKALPNYANYQLLVAAVATGKDVLNKGNNAPSVAYTAANNILALVNAIKNNAGTPSLDPVDPDTTEPDEDKKDEADKGGLTTDKNGAPNTGVLSTAEGTAAASAGIMAAVATALTAAGVGVVAFRNARRKNA